MNLTLKILSCLALTLGVIAACAPRASTAAVEAPRQVASYPKYEQINPLPAPYPEPPSGLTYNGVMQVRVDQLGAAGEKAAWLVGYYGGYVESTSGIASGGATLSMVMVFPTERFDALRNELTGLGVVEDESWNASQARWPANAWSRLTLNLRQRPQIALPPPPVIRGWDPSATFQAALGVFLRIFGFLVDLLIWIVVVLGPFALLAWLAWRVMRRSQPSNPQ